MAWFTDCDSNGLKEVFIGSAGKIYISSSSYGLFVSFFNLKELNFNNNFNTMNAMYGNFFSECSSLIELDLNSFDASNVTDMYSMFCVVYH